MTCNVYLEAEMLRTLTRCILRPPVCLATMYSVIAILSQDIHKRAGKKSVRHTICLTNPIVVPFGGHQVIIRFVSHLSTPKRPIRHMMTDGIGPRQQRTPAGRTDRTGVCLREHHSMSGQTLHIGCFVDRIKPCALRPERQRCILPAHIIHHKQNDIRPIMLCVNRGSEKNRRCLCRYTEAFSHYPHSCHTPSFH